MLLLPSTRNDSILVREVACHQCHKESQGKRKPLEAPRCSLSIPTSEQQPQIRACDMNQQALENVVVLSQVRAPHAAGFVAVRETALDQLAPPTQQPLSLGPFQSRAAIATWIAAAASIASAGVANTAKNESPSVDTSTPE